LLPFYIHLQRRLQPLVLQPDLPQLCQRRIQFTKHSDYLEQQGINDSHNLIKVPMLLLKDLELRLLEIVQYSSSYTRTQGLHIACLFLIPVPSKNLWVISPRQMGRHLFARPALDILVQTAYSSPAIPSTSCCWAYTEAFP
jgi:hypothetical protein